MAAPPPKASIDWAKLGFDTKVNGHIEVRHHLSTGEWTTPTFVESPEISVNGLCPGLNYGQQCYEGLKAFRTQTNQITVFRPRFHAARMARSAAAVCLPEPPEALFLECVRAAVAGNAAYVPPADTASYLYVRPVLFGSSAGLALAPPDEVVLAVYAQPGRPYHGAAALDGVVLDGFDRAAPRGTGAYKVGGNYAPVWRHAAEARAQGYGLTLHLDSATRTCVEEFSTSAFLGHYCRRRGPGGPEEDVLVVPLTDNAIASATSDAMVHVAKRAGWVVEHREVRFSSVGEFDEVVAVGTAAAAVPVKSLTRPSTGERFEFDVSDGKLLALSDLVARIQRGQELDPDGWNWEVTGFS